jgi:GntR family transcriptional regulator, transcriptional repressor for pyruvate dehydrogenase complex
MKAIETPARRRPRSLAFDLVDALGARIRGGQLAPGVQLPTEGQVMGDFGVSRTVVREALSRLQAAGLVRTRHGVGTFVVGPGEGAAFRIGQHELETLHDVIAMLELRIGIECEAAGLAAQRRSADHLKLMRAALDDFGRAVDEGRDAVEADFRFHGEIARATQNSHFASLLASLGTKIIPRARLSESDALDDERQAYLRRVNVEHESIFDAINAQDADAARAAMRTHLANSRERRRRAAAGPRRAAAAKKSATRSKPRPSPRSSPRSNPRSSTKPSTPRSQPR